jgi:magnesium and cobalt exporter, CNNM family
MDRRLPIHEVNDMLQLENISGQEQGRFQTLAGFVIEHMRRIPVVTDHFRWRDLRFEIVDMDGNRSDKVLVTRVAPKDFAA